MHLFLCGGGSDTQVAAAYQKFATLLDPHRPVLYVPLAMEPDRYDSCYEWITDELSPYGIYSIEMVRTASDITDLRRYSAVFIGGGNTYSLLAQLKTHGFAELQQYLHDGGIIFCGSAGAIIFGADIDTCLYADPNTVGLTDTRGFDRLHGVSLLCHFTNENPDKTNITRKYLLSLSQNRKIYALPEETTLYVFDEGFEVLGECGYYIFENGTERFVER